MRHTQPVALVVAIKPDMAMSCNAIVVSPRPRGEQHA